MDTSRAAVAKRAYNWTGASCGKAASKLQRKHKVAGLVAEMSCSKADLLKAAVEVLQRVEKPSVCRAEKDYILGAVPEDLEGADCLGEDANV